MRMLNGLSRRPGCGQLIIKGVILGAILLLFRSEINLIWNLIKAIPDLLAAQPISDQLSPDVVFNLLYLGFVILSVITLYFLVVFLVGGSVLPVRNPAEQWEAMLHFAGSLFGSHPVLVHVKEGVVQASLIETAEEVARKVRGGSVLLVDLNSAVVLEKPMGGMKDVSDDRPNINRYPLSRVGRPGLVFVHSGESLRGTVSLRRQFRINLNVMSQTNDGIDVKSHVFALFSLGQPPSIFKVAYCGDQVAESLRVLQINPETRRIQGIYDDLDALDKDEIHRFAQIFLGTLNPLAPLETTEKSYDTPPYFIDDPRIFGAVYSQARTIKEGKLDTWTDLPAQVATEIFRNMIHNIRYDLLYGLEEGQTYSLQSEFKPTFARRMRTLGVASYQFVYRQDGNCPVVGQRVDNRLYYISAVQDLRSSKILRDSGVKILAAGFSELVPADPAIKQQRLDIWRARWQRETDIIMSDLDREVELIRNRARSEKQRELITSLTQIIQNTSYSEEAVTMQVFQSLENIAAEPNTRQLLPADTIHLLQGLRLWLVPEEPTRIENRLLPGDEQSEENP